MKFELFLYMHSVLYQECLLSIPSMVVCRAWLIRPPPHPSLSGTPVVWEPFYFSAGRLWGQGWKGRELPISCRIFSERLPCLSIVTLQHSQIWSPYPCSSRPARINRVTKDWRFVDLTISLWLWVRKRSTKNRFRVWGWKKSQYPDVSV